MKPPVHFARSPISCLCLFASMAVLLLAGTVVGQTGTVKAAAPTGKPFLVFDNMSYANKPDLSGADLISSTVIYKRGEMKSAIAAGRLPDEVQFKATVKKRAAGRPGPIVIDIERLYLSKTHGATDEEIRFRFKLFITLAQWTHEAAPGHLVGYYGHGLFPEEPGREYAAETRDLIAAVDAFFPSMYVHGSQTRAQWTEKMQYLMQQAREIAPGKPVYPYMWPQYHEGGPRALEFVDGNYWKYLLETAHNFGADGVILWSGSQAWQDAPWWQVTLQFVAAKPVCLTNVHFNQPKPGKNGQPPAFEPD